MLMCFIMAVNNCSKCFSGNKLTTIQTRKVCLLKVPSGRFEKIYSANNSCPPLPGGVNGTTYKINAKSYYTRQIYCTHY